MKTGMHYDQIADKADRQYGRGFTLLEVLLVLLIVSVLTAVVLSRNSSSATRAKMLGQADLLKSQLRYAQARSLNANQVWGLRANSDRLILFNGGSVANSVLLPGESVNTVVYGAGNLAGLSVSDFTLSFDDRGRPCIGDAGTTLRTTPLRITISDAGSGTAVDIDVTPNTGFIQ